MYIEKSKMLLFRELLKPLIYNGFRHIFTKNSFSLNVEIKLEINLSSFIKALQPLILLGLQALCPFFLLCIVNRILKYFRSILRYVPFLMKQSCVDLVVTNKSEAPIYIYNKTHNVLWGVNMNSMRA